MTDEPTLPINKQERDTIEYVLTDWISYAHNMIESDAVREAGFSRVEITRTKQNISKAKKLLARLREFR
jgi:hypothetical protein